MKKSRLLSMVCTLSLFLIFSASEVRAELVTYTYSGNCFSGSNGDCAFFGLSEGDSISGFITLDRLSLSSNAFTAIPPTDPDLGFSFTFGNLSVGKIDLDPDNDIRVMFSDSTERELIFQNPTIACKYTVMPCYLLTNGSELLRIGTSFGSAQRGVSVSRTDVAYTNGAWEIVPISASVTIDIMPSKKTENVISLKKKNLKVAILGSIEFDALQVDPVTVKFGTFDPDAASPIRYKGQDYNRDGYSDLILTFNLSETGIVCGVTEATLTGQTDTDPVIYIEGSDSFTIKGCQ